MDFSKKRDTDAILRMMLYLKHELIRNGHFSEADDMQVLLEKLEQKLGDQT